MTSLFIFPAAGPVILTNQPMLLKKANPEVAEQLADAPGCQADVILEYLQQDLYQTELGYYGRGLSEAVKTKIEDLNIGGIEFKKTSIRYYPLTSFASYLLAMPAKMTAVKCQAR